MVRELRSYMPHGQKEKKKALSKEQHTTASFEDGRSHMARNAGGLSQEADSSPWLTASE